MYIGATSHLILDTPLHETLRHMADLGFGGGEWSLIHLRQFAEAENPEAAAEAAGDLARDLGLKMPQVHLSVAEMGSLDEQKREADFARMEREIELAALAGATIGVLHPVGGLPATMAEYREVERVRVESFARACEIAARYDCWIAIENTYDPHEGETSAVGRRRFGASIAELHSVLDAVDTDNFGICLDTGHTNLTGLPLGEAFRQCGERLIATHAHDNDGLHDQHNEPTRGKIDWKDGIAGLREIGWDGIFNLEVTPMRGHSLEAQLLRMRSIIETTRWLLSR